MCVHFVDMLGLGSLILPRWSRLFPLSPLLFPSSHYLYLRPLRSAHATPDLSKQLIKFYSWYCENIPDCIFDKIQACSQDEPYETSFVGGRTCLGADTIACSSSNRQYQY